MAQLLPKLLPKLLPIPHRVPHPDPTQRASTPLANRAGRALWALAYWSLVRFSPRPFHSWRALVYRAFGSRLGPGCRVYPGARIWAPWNLVCEDAVAIADGAVIYNAARIHLGSHVVISQEAYLCGASHDVDDPAFTWQARPITVQAWAWIGARATVGPGVDVGEGAVLGLCSLATSPLQPWTVYGGVPARALRARRRDSPMPAR